MERISFKLNYIYRYIVRNLCLDYISVLLLTETIPFLRKVGTGEQENIVLYKSDVRAQVYKNTYVKYTL